MLEYMRQLNLTPPLYTRLSVDQGLQNVSLDDWRKLGKVTDDTEEYLKKGTVGQEIDQLVQGLWSLIRNNTIWFIWWLSK